MTSSHKRGGSPESRAVFGGSGVAGFGEMFVVGIGVALLSLPLVTLAPAFGAGVRHFRAHLDDEPDSIRLFAVRGLQAVRSGWWFGTACAVVIALLVLNAVGAALGALPGGVTFAVVSGGLAVVVFVAMLRTAALWTPGARWIDLWREGRAVVIDDPVGTSLVLVGVAVSATVVWMLPPLIVIAPGLIVVSLVAAERRRAATSSRRAA
ncbi:MAG: hypothetical protein K0S49_2156 [Microbacterium sp.]|nr:hypothetical protein [Microbacterium sp.]